MFLFSSSYAKLSPCNRSRPFALSAKPCAAANTGAVTHARPDFTIGSSIPSAFIFSCVLSASKLAATWRAFACRRTLLSNFVQKRQSNLENFIDMPSPASLSSCVQSFNATHRCCSSLCVLQSSSHHSCAVLERLTSRAQIRVASSPQLCRVLVVVCLRSVQHATIITGIPLHVARGPSCFASESARFATLCCFVRDFLFSCRCCLNLSSGMRRRSLSHGLTMVLR